MNNIEPGERALVINSNCKAFLFDNMYDWEQRTTGLTPPRRYTWYQLAILRAYSWLTYRPAS